MKELKLLKNYKFYSVGSEGWKLGAGMAEAREAFTLTNVGNYLGK